MATTMLGKITLFPYDFEPGGWMFCDGRKLFIGENDSLFALIGDAFGGDGDSFALPDLTKVAPPNCHFCIAVEGFFRETYYSGIMCETILSAEPQLRTKPERVRRSVTTKEPELRARSVHGQSLWW